MDDASAAAALLAARELEKDVVDRLRSDGSFDKFRRRVVEEVNQKAGPHLFFFSPSLPLPPPPRPTLPPSLPARPSLSLHLLSLAPPPLSGPPRWS
jgi:hypothetical protein